MQFISKTEVYVFLFAAFTVALIYYVAFDHILSTGTTSATSILSKIMGQDASGKFQAPFA